LHSCWNALTKGARDQFAFLCSAVAVASVLFLPVTLWTLPAGGVPAAAWPFVGATVVLHALYFYALGRSYRSGSSRWSTRSHAASGWRWCRCSPPHSSTSARHRSAASASRLVVIGIVALPEGRWPAVGERARLGPAPAGRW
jgi:hypothetical protein